MTPILAYFGPETVLPATSILATIVGVVLMLGKNSLWWCLGMVKNVLGLGGRPGRQATPTVPAPHFAATRKVMVDQETR